MYIATIHASAEASCWASFSLMASAEEGVPPEGAKAVENLVATAQAEGREAALFASLDTNGDGQVSRQELIDGMAARGRKLTDPEAEAIIAAADEDGDGAIDRVEFGGMGRHAPLPPFLRRPPTTPDNWCPLPPFLRKGGTVAELVAAVVKEGDALKLFASLDANGDGQVTREELMAGMAARGQTLTETEADVIMAEADSDSSGGIDRVEFGRLIELQRAHYEGGGAEPEPELELATDVEGKVIVLMTGTPKDQATERRRRQQQPQRDTAALFLYNRAVKSRVSMSMPFPCCVVVAVVVVVVVVVVVFVVVIINDDSSSSSSRVRSISCSYYSGQ